MDMCYTNHTSHFSSVGMVMCNVGRDKCQQFMENLSKIIGKRAKRARHYQGCTNSSWCSICVYIYISFITTQQLNFVCDRADVSFLATR